MTICKKARDIVIDDSSYSCRNRLLDLFRLTSVFLLWCCRPCGAGLLKMQELRSNYPEGAYLKQQTFVLGLRSQSSPTAHRQLLVSYEYSFILLVFSLTFLHHHEQMPITRRYASRQTFKKSFFVMCSILSLSLQL